MNTLYSLRIRPLGPWITPWQADTLAGMLCHTAASTHGHDWLQRNIIHPALHNQPPFVLSDPTPADMLPIPLWLRLHPWPEEHRKRARKARWLAPDTFSTVRTGQPPPPQQLIPEQNVLRTTSRLRNAIDRSNNTTLTHAGLFARREHWLDTTHPAVANAPWLTLYLRVQPAFLEDLLHLIDELSLVGYGEDARMGMGAFQRISPPQPATFHNQLPHLPNCTPALLSLSTFQPGHADPTKGMWETFVKYGRLGPALGLDDVRKRPLILFRPGACLIAAEPKPWIGRAVPPADLLPPQTLAHLAQKAVAPIHYAFGLTMPINIPTELCP